MKFKEFVMEEHPVTTHDEYMRKVNNIRYELVNTARRQLEKPPYNFVWDWSMASRFRNDFDQQHSIMAKREVTSVIDAWETCQLGVDNQLSVISNRSSDIPLLLYIELPELNWLNKLSQVNALEHVPFFSPAFRTFKIDNRLVWALGPDDFNEIYNLNIYSYFDIYEFYSKLNESDVVRRGLKTLEYAKKVFIKYSTWLPEWEEFFITAKLEYYKEHDITMSDWANLI